MKKYIIPLLASLVLLATGTAFAQIQDPPLQDDASHDLIVTIPAAVMIRIVPTDASPSAAVAFDFVSDDTAYLAAIDTPAGDWVDPTSHNLGAIEVLAVGSGWRVAVQASAALTNTAIDLDQVRVTSTVTAIGDFVLDTAAADIATGPAGTWQSLGISGNSYELFVDGSETAGSDTITVTYTVYQN